MAETKTNTPLPEGWDAGKEVESNWFKFNKVGDHIKGTLLNKRFQKGEGQYGDQWIYELKSVDGNIWNVPVSAKKSGTVQRLNSCQAGEIIGILFNSEGESAVKGGHKAKNLQVRSFGVDETFKNDEEELSIEDIGEAMNQ